MDRTPLIWRPNSMGWASADRLRGHTHSPRPEPGQAPPHPQSRRPKKTPRIFRRRLKFAFRVFEREKNSDLCFLRFAMTAAVVSAAMLERQTFHSQSESGLDVGPRAVNLSVRTEHGGPGERNDAEVSVDEWVETVLSDSILTRTSNCSAFQTTDILATPPVEAATRTKRKGKVLSSRVSSSRCWLDSLPWRDTKTKVQKAVIEADASRTEPTTMADPNSALGPLPNGWECRNDPRTRRNYFINFINKTTTWDDPRVKPSIVHSPPPYNEPTTDIFTMQDISSYRPSPVPGRVHTAPLMGSHAIGHHSSSKINETSFSTAVATEHSVAKISAMFPTVSETHIRALLIKYMKSMFPKADETIILDTLYNVENNVLAATNQLQAMGFDKKDSTPSCGGTPSSKGKETEKSVKSEKKEKVVPTPTPSARLRSVVEKQEMRDRLKKVHPDLAEQLISMALDSVDYDENRASHILNIMIKDEITPKSTQPNSASSSQRPQSNKSNDAEVSSLGTKTTVEADIAARSPHKTTVARETADELSRTEQSTIEDVVSSEKTTDTKEFAAETKGPSSKTVSTSATIHCPSNKSSLNESSLSPPNKSSIKKTKGKKDVPKVSRGTSTTEDKEYRSAHRLRACGPNSSLHHGPNDELLLEDYVTWAGPSRQTKDSLTAANGPNKNLLGAHRYTAKGPNRDACKGPQKGLAKGSLYSHLAACNAASALVAVESRGK